MVITQTPLRISFAGGGTDFPDFYKEHDGEVVSSTIDKYVYALVKERFDDKIVVNYSKLEMVDDVSQIRHELVREALRMTHVGGGVEIVTVADVPSKGTGLGSSSAVTVGVLNALYAYRGKQIPAERLAEEACEIEIGFCKKPIGKQDQYIATYGGLRWFTFRKDQSVRPWHIRLSEEDWKTLDSRLMLFYTAKTRLSSGILTEQRDNIPDKVETLKKMADQAATLADRLCKGKIDAIGPILERGWVLKTTLASGITSPEIQEMYLKAVRAGATGGKICGAGGGGFLLVYCPLDRQDAVRSILQGYRELPFHLEPDGSKVIFNQRRRIWT